jgi:DNA-directed RNA polymerase subunit L
MELRVITREDQELSIEIGGEDHTFMNVLKGALLETDGVVAATYDVNPEQSGGQTDPVLTVTTEEGVDPLDAIGEAAESIRETTDSFRDAFADASTAA